MAVTKMFALEIIRIDIFYKDYNQFKEFVLW